MAIPISQDIKAEVAAWQRSYPSLPVRWMLPQGLHVTLVPPWPESDPERAAKTVSQAVAGIGPFRIGFQKITYGPNLREPRLIWAEGPAVPKMLDLQEKLVKTLSAAPPRHDLRLHLTLARFNPRRFSSFPVKHIEEKIHWAQNVDSIVLYQSQTLADSAKYTVVETFKL